MRLLAAIFALSAISVAQGVGGLGGFGGSAGFGGGASGGGGGAGTFTLSNTVADRATYANKLNCATTTCTLTIPSTTGKAAAIAIYDSGGAGQILSSVSSTGSSWVVPAGCKASSGPVGDTAMSYTLSLGGGVTSITLTLTQNFADTVVVYWEYAYTGSSVSFDNCWTANTGTLSASQSGPTLTLAGGTEVVATMMSMSAAPASVTVAAPYLANLVKANDTSASLSACAASTVVNTPSNTASSWTLGTAERAVFGELALIGN